MYGSLVNTLLDYLPVYMRDFGRQIVCRRFDKWFVGDCRRLAPHQTSIWIIWSGSIGPLFSMDEKTRKLYHNGDRKCATLFESMREINWMPKGRLTLGLLRWIRPEGYSWNLLIQGFSFEKYYNDQIVNIVK